MRAFLCAAVAVFAVANAQQVSQNLRMPEEVAIFAIASGSDSFRIEPIVFVHYGVDQQLKVVPSLNATTASESAETNYCKQELRSAYF